MNRTGATSRSAAPPPAVQSCTRTGACVPVSTSPSLTAVSTQRRASPDTVRRAWMWNLSADGAPQPEIHSQPIQRLREFESFSARVFRRMKRTPGCFPPRKRPPNVCAPTCISHFTTTASIKLSTSVPPSTGRSKIGPAAEPCPSRNPEARTGPRQHLGQGVGQRCRSQRSSIGRASRGRGYARAHQRSLRGERSACDRPGGGNTHRQVQPSPGYRGRGPVQYRSRAAPGSGGSRARC